VSGATVLVMAKAPVVGEVKTRLGATVGAHQAALLANAALLDTLTVCASVFPPGQRVLALAGSVARSVEPTQLQQAVSGWDVVDQVGATFAHRLMTAHSDVHASHGGPVVQVGMDTPHVTARHLEHVIAATGAGFPVLGRAHDGGWWVLATTSPTDVAGLHRVPMSRPETWARTRAVIEGAAGKVLPTAELGDVDTAADARAVAAAAPRTRFARAWHKLDATPESRTA
jgi:glycosyltransferase A (GT-A) superfamily protein (DUF2064 family)